MEPSLFLPVGHNIRVIVCVNMTGMVEGPRIREESDYSVADQNQNMSANKSPKGAPIRIFEADHDH